MNSVLTKISAIKRNPNNPRILKDDKFVKLTQSIKDFPQMLDIRPIVVNDDMVVLGGNMRLKACKEAGLKEVPVMKVSALTEEQQREFIIKDNVGFGEWDWELLQAEWDNDLLEDWGLGLDFDPVDDKEGLTDEDDVPEVTENPVSKVGDIWLLGEHRVMCGDSTSSANVDKLMNGAAADMVFTDPPYGMNLDVSNSNNLGGKGTWKNKAKNYTPVIGDDGDYDPTHIFEMFPNVKEMFLWGFDYFAEFIPNRKSGSVVVWDKRKGVEDMKLTFSEFELCWSMKKHLREFVRITWSGILGTEQEFDHKRHHPTQKPIALSVWFIDKYSEKDWTVVDLFLGSGSTLIACEKLTRKCYGMELDPKYVDVIIKRWQDYTGKKAIHAETGDEFIEVSND